MGFTKIGAKEPWNQIITEDVQIATSRKPNYVLAERFKVYRLKVTSFNALDERTLVLLIDGRKNERLFLIIKIDLRYNMLDSLSIKRSLLFDYEIATYLKYAIILRMSSTYHIPERILKIK